MKDSKSTSPAATSETALASQFQVTALEPRHEAAASYSGSTNDTELEQWGPTGC